MATRKHKRRTRRNSRHLQRNPVAMFALPLLAGGGYLAYRASKAKAPAITPTAVTPTAPAIVLRVPVAPPAPSTPAVEDEMARYEWEPETAAARSERRFSRWDERARALAPVAGIGNYVRSY